MSTIFNNKSKLNTFLFAVVLTMVALMVIDCGNDSRRQSELDGWKNVALTKGKEAEIWKNKEGLSRARADVAEADTKTLSQAYAKEFKRIESEFKIKEKNFKGATIVKTEIKGELKVVTKDSLIYIDTTKVKARVFSYRDRWTSISGHFLRDSLALNYKFWDSLTLVHSWKKKHLQIDAISSNPNSTILGLTSLSVKAQKPSRFGIGPFVGVGITGRPVVGVGVQWNVIKF